MTIPFLQVKPKSVKLKVTPLFPARVEGRIGIGVDKENGTYFLDLDYSDFAPAPLPPDILDLYTLIWDSVTGQYILAQITQFMSVTEAPVDGQVYGRENASWVVIGQNVLEAPIDGHTYGRNNAAWVQALPLAGGVTTTGGFGFTSYNIGTISSGTVTPNAMSGNYQYLSNAGAFTLAAPTADCAIDILMSNGAGAGAVTFTGFTVGNTGDALDTTSGHNFIISVRRINSVATYIVKALQ